MESKRILTALVAVMLTVVMLITGCKKNPAVSDIDTDAPATNMPNVSMPDDSDMDYGEDTEDEINDGSLKDTVYAEGMVDVKIVFEPRDYIPDANWANYAAEAVSEIATSFAAKGNDVYYADLLCVKILDEGCNAGLSDVVYTMTVDYAIYVWGEDADPSTDEPDIWDGAKIDDLGRLFLCVGNFDINGKQCEEYTFYREAEINSTYGADNPERFVLAAVDNLGRMKDKHANVGADFDEVINFALSEMYTAEGDGDNLSCYSWSYTYGESESDPNVIEADVVICTVEYRLTEKGIERTSVTYSHMDWCYSKTTRGYELITWYGYDAEEDEKDPSLVVACDSQAAALFAVDAEIIG